MDTTLMAKRCFERAFAACPAALPFRLCICTLLIVLSCCTPLSETDVVCRSIYNSENRYNSFAINVNKSLA